MGNPRMITREMKISATPEVWLKLERFFALMHFNRGHTAIFGIAFDGDGADAFKIDPPPREELRKPAQRIGDAGDGIGGAGAGGDEDDAGLAGRPRIALRRMGRRLFVADKDVLDARAVGVRPEHRIIDRQDCPAGVAEHDLHAEIAQRLDQDVCSALFAHGSSPPELRLVRRG